MATKAGARRAILEDRWQTLRWKSVRYEKGYSFTPTKLGRRLDDALEELVVRMIGCETMGDEEQEVSDIQEQLQSMIETTIIEWAEGIEEGRKQAAA
jgi:hypothetical protein